MNEITTSSASQVSDEFLRGRLDILFWIAESLNDTPLELRTPKQLSDIYRQSAFQGTKAVIADIASRPLVDISEQDFRISQGIITGASFQIHHDPDAKASEMKDAHKKEILERVKVLGWRQELVAQMPKLQLAASFLKAAPDLNKGLFMMFKSMESMQGKIEAHLQGVKWSNTTDILSFSRDTRGFPRQARTFELELKNIR